MWYLYKLSVVTNKALVGGEEYKSIFITAIVKIGYIFHLINLRNKHYKTTHIQFYFFLFWRYEILWNY